MTEEENSNERDIQLKRIGNGADIFPKYEETAKAIQKDEKKKSSGILSQTPEFSGTSTAGNTGCNKLYFSTEPYPASCRTY